MTDKTIHKNFKPVGSNTSGEDIAVTLGAARSVLESADGPRKVTDALRSLSTYPGNTVRGRNAIQGLVVAGPAVWANADKVDGTLHPVWRNALLHIAIAPGWPDDIPIAGSARNTAELDRGGSSNSQAARLRSERRCNHPHLYSIKQKWDPQNLSIVRTGFGSEDWDAEGLCRKQNLPLSPLHKEEILCFWIRLGDRSIQL
ncbi:hypothetical protein PISL3812_02976 [Talaromyces islandicus]|uniref:Uncharacterized protein n=1 Tax=Talaromyces islandicus TaxID=28573 RepID=A0A0U1LRD6_TALIS|nr:hypothetical protein PISL3812_02976 [Talaromyces islandicus]